MAEVVDLTLALFFSSENCRERATATEQSPGETIVMPIVSRWNIFRARWWKSSFLPELFRPMQDFRNYRRSDDTSVSIQFVPPSHIRAPPLPSDLAAATVATAGFTFESQLPSYARTRFLDFLMSKQFVASGLYELLCCVGWLQQRLPSDNMLCTHIFCRYETEMRRAADAKSEAIALGTNPHLQEGVRFMHCWLQYCLRLYVCMTSDTCYRACACHRE